MALQFGRSRLAILLDKKRMSQAEFAKRLDVSEPYVSQLIKGHRKFSLLMGKRAAKVLGCYIDDLYEWEE